MKAKLDWRLKPETKRAILPLMLVARIGAIGVVAFFQVVYGSWIWSVGMALIWFIVWNSAAGVQARKLEMPKESLKLLVDFFPPKGKATVANSESFGLGTIDGFQATFALKVDKEALALSIYRPSIFRTRRVTIPWNQIDMGPVRFDGDGDYVASLSVRTLPGCNFVLPWRREFPNRVDGGVPIFPDPSTNREAVESLKTTGEPWSFLEKRFPRRRKVTFNNAECVGHGTIDGKKVKFELIADKEALSLNILGPSWHQLTRATIPWDQIDLGQVGFDEDGNYVASLSFRALPECKFVLPWRIKFPSRIDEGRASGWNEGPHFPVPSTKPKAAV